MAPFDDHCGCSISGTAGRPGLARTGFVDADCATIQWVFIEGLNRLLPLIGVGHLDKSKAFGATGFPIHDDVGAQDLTMGRKGREEILGSDVVGQITDVDIHVGFS